MARGNTSSTDSDGFLTHEERLEAEGFRKILELGLLFETEQINKARTIISQTVKMENSPNWLFSFAIEKSVSLIKGYATLNEKHRAEILTLIKQIRSYLADKTKKRPFNVLMLASPGAGKSHFIKQLAATMTQESVQAVTFNMATMGSLDDLAWALDQFRNIKVIDKFPILFLDEFDCDECNYKTLLPLLWDGELQAGHRKLSLGKAVIILAGSRDRVKSAAMKDVYSWEVKSEDDKLPDLLSRINGGVITIPELEQNDDGIDKVCMLIALLRLRFGEDLRRVSRSLLRFVANTRFQYATRSIAHLIDTISFQLSADGELKIDDKDPDIKQQKFHFMDGVDEVVKKWNELANDSQMIILSQPRNLLNLPLIKPIKVNALSYGTPDGLFFPGYGKVEWFQDSDGGPEMVIVPAGKFAMGSPVTDPEGEGSERPRHQVTIARPFAVSRHAVTRDQFAKFVEQTGYDIPARAYVPVGLTDVIFVKDSTEWKEDPDGSWRNPGFHQNKDHPVVCVSWNDAKAFAKWLSEVTGKDYRLLTEAEWEYAARAGTTTRFWWGSSISEWNANYDDWEAVFKDEAVAKPRRTAPVKTFDANHWGLYQVHGNVWEWCEDYWHDNYDSAPSDGSAWLQGSDAYRAIRGGSWDCVPGSLRAARRNKGAINTRSSDIGFRVGLTL